MNLQDLKDKCIIVAKSVDQDDLCPPYSDIVRAELKTSGWVLVPRGNITLATFIVQVDLKGKIPTSVMNLIATRQPLSIYYVRLALEKDPSLRQSHLTSSS